MLLSSLQTYLTLLQSNVLAWFLLGPLLLIGLDIITGILSAVKQRIFTWKRFDDFLETSVLPYLGILLIVFLAYQLSGSSVAANIAIALGMMAHGTATIGSIVENLQELGVPSPIVEEVQQVSKQVVQTPLPAPAPTRPPVQAAPASLQAALPVDRQTTQVQPAIADVVRTNTPPVQPLPSVVPTQTPVAAPPPVIAPSSPIDPEPVYPSWL